MTLRVTGRRASLEALPRGSVGTIIPAKLQKLLGQQPDEPPILSVCSPVIVHVRTQDQLQNPVVIKVTCNGFVDCYHPFAKVHPHRFRRAVTRAVISEDVQVALSLIRLVPAELQISLGELAKRQKISPRVTDCLFPIQRCIRIKLKMNGVHRSPFSTVPSDHVHVTHPCASFSKGQPKSLHQGGPCLVSPLAVR
ncbi:hypothetical protein BK658_05085 [Pseudomonas brassicacearum]|uniref:Uncharacterized protein n=1 Tax=Pseudomonas brassicacearum TaxID=930166 RepID=A0A423GZ61_9PSED|nr:hypothetical protein BK658_05085 [Pseudomonas brassicacearum]